MDFSILLFQKWSPIYMTLEVENLTKKGLKVVVDLEIPSERSDTLLNNMHVFYIHTD